jgi:anti-sigma B factor antagonist
MTIEERDVRWSGRHAVVTLPAEIDVTNTSSVEDMLAAVAAQSPEVMTVDLTATVFCDSAGVHALARAHQLAAASGGELRLALGDSPVARIIQLIGLDKIVPVYSDVQQSLETPRTGPESSPAPAG